MPGVWPIRRNATGSRAGPGFGPGAGPGPGPGPGEAGGDATSGPAGRRIACPACGRSMIVARRALSARCPGCTRPVRFEDVRIRGLTTGTLATMGTVEVTRRGRAQGRIDCGRLAVSGRVEAVVRVRGPVTMGPRAEFAGTLSARSLVIEPGGRFRADLCLGPDEHGDGAETKNRGPSSTRGGLTRSAGSPRGRGGSTPARPRVAPGG